MPGPTPMALGSFHFKALGFSFKGVKRDLETPWADIETVGQLDAQQWVGPKSDSVTISGVLFPEEFGGLDTLDGVRAAAFAGLPLMLVTLAGEIRGLHTIQGVSEDRSEHTRHALPRRNAYQIKLRRYKAKSYGGIAALFGI